MTKLLPALLAVLVVLVAPGDAEAAQTLTCDKWDNGCDAPWYCFISENLTAGCTPDDIWDAIFYEDWVLYVTGGLVACFVLGLGATLFPGMKVDGDDPYKFDSGLHDVQLYGSVGVVVEKFVDTQINVSTSTSVDGFGVARSSTSVSSHSRTFARVRSDHGGDGVVDVTGFDIADGESLYSLWAVEDKCVRGPQALGNVSRDRFVTYPNRMVKLVRFSRAPMVFLLAAEIVTLRWWAILTVPVTWLVYVILGAPFTSSRLRRLQNHVNGSLFPLARRTRVAR